MTWTAYALIEAGFCTLRPLIAGDQQIVNSTNWKFTAILFGAYIAAGILSGAVVGLVAPKLGRQRQTGERAVPPYQQLTALTVAIGYLATALTEPSQSVAIKRLALAIGLVIVAGIGAELLWPVLRRRTSIFSDPWTAAVLLVSGPWLLSSVTISHLGEIVIVTAAAFAVSARVLNRGPGIGGFRIRHALAAGAGILMIPAIALVASENAGPLPARETAGQNSHRPNIVLVVLDTVRADHLSLSGYGRRTTPWLEEFARESTVFARATAASNFTLPTHATMFTGLYPRSHGATIFPPGKSLGQPLDGKFETLAEALSKRGYLNYGITANYGYLGREFGLDQGFHFYDVRRLVQCFPERLTYLLRFGVRRILTRFMDASESDFKCRRADDINKQAFAVLTHAKANGPFFVFLNYMDAHEPYVPPAPFHRLYPGYDPRFTYQDYHEMERDVIEQRRPMQSRERDHLVSQYDGAISYLDSQIKELVSYLRKLELYDDTLLIITADHGEAMGERSLVGHGRSIYQHQVFIPLVIKYAGQHAAAKVLANVSQVDLMPTILDAAGAALPASLQGENLSRLGDFGPRNVYAENSLHADLARFRPDYPAYEWAVISPGNQKLISSSDGKQQLYDLAEDPTEEHDLEAARRASSIKLLAALESWKESVPLEVKLSKPADAKTMERLRGLGYVQ